ncbi:MAG: hypothetical protein ACOYNY_04295 [Caldilineaceae bacterium]
MGLLNRQQRNTLIALLQQLPNVSDVSARDVLLATLPTGLQTSIRSVSVSINQIHHIVDITEHDTWAPLPDGSYPITIVIQNAVSLVVGSTLAGHLQTFLADIPVRSIAGASSPTYQPPKVSNFDLTRQIDDCFEELEPRRGLIGFVIACDVPDFQNHLCERLLDRLRDSHLDTDVRRPTPLKLQFTSLNGAIQELKRYKGILQYKNVLCPVPVQIYDEQGCTELLVRFWQGLTNEFTGNFAHRLILLLFCNTPIVCPPNMVTLTSPSFKEAQLRHWFAPIVHSLQWANQEINADQIIEHWKREVLTACQRENHLAIHYVYDYLKETLHILQQRPSREQFFRELAARSQYYV